MEPIVLDGILAKTESTYGTDSVPVVGTDGVRISEHIWSQLSYEFAYPNERDEAAAGSLIPLKAGTPEGKVAELELVVPLIGAGAAYDNSSVWPEARPLILATPVAEAVDTTSSAETVTYTHADTGHGSCTIYAYGGGQLFKITGCRGTMEWPMEAGVLNRVTFRMRGVVAEVSDVSLPVITYSTLSPPPAVNMSLTLNPGSSWSPDFVSAAFRQGAAIQQLADGNAANGIEGMFVSRVEPVFDITVRKAALATYNPYSLADARTNHLIDLETGSAAQYEQIALDANLAYLMSPPRAVDDQEFAGWELAFRLNHYALIFK